MPFLAMGQPNQNEILKLKSVNTITELNAIVNPSAGCLVYISNNQTIFYYDGSSWVSIGNPWFINGNQCQNNHFLGTTNNQDLSFKTNNEERMLIKNDGKIGIQTNTPDARFQIGRSGGGWNDISHHSTTTSNMVDPCNVFVDNNLNTSGVIYVDHEIQHNGTASDPKLVLQYTIKADQNPPIDFNLKARLNDSSPWVTLDSLTNVTWPATNYLTLYLANNTAYEDYKITFTKLQDPNNPHSSIWELQLLEFVTVQPAFAFTDNGRVGINHYPVTPDDLQVGGSILADAFTPDYVFEHHFDGYSEQYPNYSQLTLKETKDFIKKHKHLPGIPSAKDIQKQGGIIINQAVDANLEKIEELYLHLFDLNHRMKELESLIAEKENMR